MSYCTAADVQKHGTAESAKITSPPKDTATPIKTTKIINNIKVTAKFRRLTKILDKLGEKLRTTGKTEHLERVIRDT